MGRGFIGAGALYWVSVGTDPATCAHVIGVAFSLPFVAPLVIVSTKPFQQGDLP